MLNQNAELSTIIFKLLLYIIVFLTQKGLAIIFVSSPINYCNYIYYMAYLITTPLSAISEWCSLPMANVQKHYPFQTVTNIL